jgi:2-oxoglutarate/2-oxoacid ferredoxin oxidoreductase subunit alpha
MRIRALPFSDKVRDFIKNYDRVYVVEMNRDGQMHQLMKIEYPEQAANLVSLSIIDGLPLTADWVENAVAEKEKIS